MLNKNIGAFEDALKSLHEGLDDLVESLKKQRESEEELLKLLDEVNDKINKINKPRK